jgi:hypothetical protein
MKNGDRRPHGHVMATTITKGHRAALAIVGLISWAAGGTASFLTSNGVGAASLVAAGVACAVLALIGRWPSRISMSGNELAWDAVEKTVESEMKLAESAGESQALAVLTELQERLATLQRTGAVPEHPAETYDRQVEAAIRRLLPRASVTREALRSHVRADFIVRQDGHSVFVETKWRRDTARPFHGSTLPTLVSGLPASGKLLIVVNADEIDSQAFEHITSLQGRSRVVRWKDLRDDTALGQALIDLLGLRN